MNKESRSDGRLGRRAAPKNHGREEITEVNPMTEKSVILGVISDTHGLLRPEALRALHESDRILHAGDVGAPPKSSKHSLKSRP